MANAKLKVKQNGAFVQIHPETNLNQIKDMTTKGRAIATIAGSSGFVYFNSEGQASLRSSSQILTDIGAAPLGHEHTISDITDWSTAISEKAGLEGGKIKSEHIPSWLLGGLRFSTTVGGSVVLDETFRTAMGITNTLESAGRYAVVTEDNTSVTLGADTIIDIGDAGEDPGGVLILEQGDWIVYSGFTEDSKYSFSIVNNKYQNATNTIEGVVKLSEAATFTRRSQLAATGNANRVLDEGGLKKIMKDIYIQTTEPSDALEGDLLIQLEA